jgi:maleate cis-trans isomerase
MEHTQASKLVMEQITEYMIDGEEEEEQHDVIVTKDKIWEELKVLQCNRINVQFPFIKEVVQVILEVRSLFYLY